METLYDILEVSPKASKEIIEKAYRILVKRYHPDLQEATNKEDAEKMMQKINEAYEILSNEDKRKKYDEKLEQQKQQKTLQNEIDQQDTMEKNNNWKEQSKLQEHEDKIREKYDNYYKQFEYRKKEGINTKDILAAVILIAIILVVFFIIWITPQGNRWMINLYNGNTIIKIIVNLFVGIFSGIDKTIKQI